MFLDETKLRKTWNSKIFHADIPVVFRLDSEDAICDTKKKQLWSWRFWFFKIDSK